MVIWITGLSGSGKTTLCEAFRRLYKPRCPGLVVLDGDGLRAALGNDLGYGEADRITQVRRLQGLARLLSDQGLTVLVAVLYSHPDLLAWNRSNLADYLEVYLSVPEAVLRRRNQKGLYEGAESGAAADVVGFDIPWRPPEHPDVVIDGASGVTPELAAQQVAAAISSRGLVQEWGSA